MRRSTLLTLALAVSSFWSPAARADEAWTTTGTKNGVVFEKRAVGGSKFFEYRATTQIALSPAQVLESIWSSLTDKTPPEVKTRRVLKRSGDEVVVYDQFDTPVVRDRDATLRFYKVARPGVLEVRFESNDALGPPGNPKFVRLPVVRGAWTLEAAPSGATRLTYVCYSEPGGSIPAFLVRGAQQDHVAADVQQILAHLRGN
jgi:hypothetical protein